MFYFAILNVFNLTENGVKIIMWKKVIKNLKWAQTKTCLFLSISYHVISYLDKARR